MMVTGQILIDIAEIFSKETAIPGMVCGIHLNNMCGIVKFMLRPKPVRLAEFIVSDVMILCVHARKMIMH